MLLQQLWPRHQPWWTPQWVTKVWSGHKACGTRDRKTRSTRTRRRRQRRGQREEGMRQCSSRMLLARADPAPPVGTLPSYAPKWALRLQARSDAPSKDIALLPLRAMRYLTFALQRPLQDLQAQVFSVCSTVSQQSERPAGNAATSTVSCTSLATLAPLDAAGTRAESR